MVFGLFQGRVKKALLDARIALAENNGANRAILDQLRNYILKATSNELAHMNLAQIATEWGLAREKLIPSFLHAAKAGVLELHFVIHCQTCKGSGDVQTLKAVLHEMTCPACKSQVLPALDRSVEALFLINQEIANVRPQKTPSTVDYLLGIEVINTDEFRLFFEAEKPLPKEHILVNNLAFLFTDLSGSTATYERLGDGNAYKIVRDHFTILFEEIKKHNGAVVKTIGDAVMATFLSPESAVACALQVKKEFDEFNKRRDVKGAAGIKIGIHAGRCLAVTLNQRLDFFGATVNKAARVQGVAEKNQICLTQDVAQESAVAKLLAKIKTQTTRVVLKGIKKPVEVVCI